MYNRQGISTLLGIAAAVVLVTNSHAADINVPGDQPTIQAGITAAINGDVVIVAQGEYFENINFNGKAITVRSTVPNDAGAVMHTIINGGGLGTVVICENGEGPNTVLSGFVITGGNFDNGGGMANVLNSSPTVTNCSFIGNTATFLGGGMYNFGGSSPTVTNCTFSGNLASSSGGGMYNAFASNPTVTNCTFIGNSAFHGGGMANGLGGNPIVTDCTFSGNSASNRGGGMYNFDVNVPTVTNCTFSGNSADFGGGMFNIFNSSPTVTNCSFIGNTANTNGGGMFNDGSSPTLINTGFCGNTPDQINGSFTDGGGNSLLYCPPPIPIPDPCPADINGDGVTNVLDLIDLLLAFGTSCP